MVAGYATEMAKNIHSFEILVGPYAVAHLRLSERIMEAGGSLPADGVHVYLTDTLESPNASPPGSSCSTRAYLPESTSGRWA